MTSTVLMAMSSGVLEAAASVGLDAEALREAAGIGRDELADPDARLPLERHLRLWELLSRHPLGLEIGARMGLAGMGVIGYAMQHGESVGDALAWLWRDRAVIHPEVVPAFEVRPVVRENETHRGAAGLPQSHDVLAVVLVLLRGSELASDLGLHLGELRSLLASSSNRSPLDVVEERVTRRDLTARRDATFPRLSDELTDQSHHVWGQMPSRPTYAAPSPRRSAKPVDAAVEGDDPASL